ncbi:MAG: SOS response-associated peptidase [Alphaproteobacteria bacterium]
MCGRYSITMPVEAMRRLFRITGELPALLPRFNVAPGQAVPIVRPAEGEAADGRSLVMMRWGLIPSWAKEPQIGYRMINARAETMAEKPAFRAAFRARRCLVVADGFYEWKSAGRTKQPYRIELADRSPFAFAGLWERWQAPEDAPIESCTILTTEANELLRPIHDRMPVILDEAGHEPWLAVGQSRSVAGLLRPCPAERMAAYAISSRINSPRNDDSGVLERVVPQHLLL